MPKFSINIASILSSNQQGPNFNIQLEAAHFLDALERAKPALQAVLDESGLIMLPAANGPVPAALEAPAPIAGSTEG